MTAKAYLKLRSFSAACFTTLTNSRHAVCLPESHWCARSDTAGLAHTDAAVTSKQASAHIAFVASSRIVPPGEIIQHRVEQDQASIYRYWLQFFQDRLAAAR